MILIGYIDGFLVKKETRYNLARYAKKKERINETPKATKPTEEEQTTKRKLSYDDNKCDSKTTKV